jgi:hypothetical protein
MLDDALELTVDKLHPYEEKVPLTVEEVIPLSSDNMWEFIKSIK